MATSGSIAGTTFTNASIMDMAFRRAGIPAQKITGEMLAIAKQDLALLFTEWTNKGIQLWCLDKVVLPYVVGQAIVQLPAGTIDVMNALHRSMTQVVGSGVAASDRYTITLTEASAITTFGLTLSAGGTFSTMIEASNDAISWTVLSPATSYTYTANYRQWLDVDNGTAYLYYRFRESTGAAISVVSTFLGNSPYEIPVTAVNQDTYTSYPDKTFQGRPTQWWYYRGLTPSMYLWPTPNNPDNMLVVWRRRHIMDPGTFLNNPEVPQNWWSALVNNLAVYLIMDIPEADPSRMAMIQPLAVQTFSEAQANEEDPGPLMINVDLSAYTA